jgi:hypothetical protein
MQKPTTARGPVSILQLAIVSFLAQCLIISVVRADLYVVDSGVVDRFNSTTGAVIQTNGQNTFATPI